MKQFFLLTCTILSLLLNSKTQAQGTSSVVWNSPSWELGMGAVFKHHEDFSAGRLVLGTHNIMIKNRIGIYYTLEYRGKIDFKEDQSNYYFRDILGFNYSISERFSVNAGLGIFRKGILQNGAERGGEYFYNNIQFGRLRKELGITYKIPEKPWSFNFAYSTWVGPTVTVSYNIPFDNTGSTFGSVGNRRLFLGRQPRVKNPYDSDPTPTNDKPKADSEQQKPKEKPKEKHESKPLDTPKPPGELVVPRKQKDTIEAIKNKPAVNKIDSLNNYNKPLDTTAKVDVDPKPKQEIINKVATNDSVASVVQPSALSVDSNSNSLVPIPSSTSAKSEETATPPKRNEFRAKIYFPFDVDTMNISDKDSLHSFLKQINIDLVKNVKIFGTADKLGTDAYNFNLSQSRANHVRDYIISFGIKSNIINVFAYGESKSTGTTEIERALNRYVEIVIQIDY